jgi:hypothetical protein
VERFHSAREEEEPHAVSSADKGPAKERAKELTTTPAKELTTTPAKELTTTPAKELTTTPAKELTTTPAKELTPAKGAGKGPGKGPGKEAGKGPGKGSAPPPPPRGKKVIAAPTKASLSCTQLRCFKGVYDRDGLADARLAAKDLQAYFDPSLDPEAVQRESITLGTICDRIVTGAAEALHALALRMFDFNVESAESWGSALRLLMGTVSEISSARAKDDVGWAVEPQDPLVLIENLRKEAGPGVLRRDIADTASVLAPALAAISRGAHMVRLTRLPSPDVAMSTKERSYLYGYVEGKRVPSAANIEVVLKRVFSERGKGCLARYLTQKHMVAKSPVALRQRKLTALEQAVGEVLDRLLGADNAKTVDSKVRQNIAVGLRMAGGTSGLAGALAGLSEVLAHCAHRSRSGDPEFRHVLEELSKVLAKAGHPSPVHAPDEILSLWAGILGAVVEEKDQRAEEHVALTLRGATALQRALREGASAVAVAQRLTGGDQEVSKEQIMDASMFLNVLRDVYDKAMGPGVLGLCKSA